MSQISLEHWEPTGETSKSYRDRLESGFLHRYLSGPIVLDIGYKGDSSAEARPVTPDAIGVDLDYPGYDGATLPWPEGSVDTVFASHVLEHIEDYRSVIRDWHRVLKVSGYIVCHVPHQFLYEKKLAPPSNFNGDHKRFYTPGRLMAEFEESLEPNSYRLRYMADFDQGHDYSLGPETHSNWGYEIQAVIQKLKPPVWAPAP